MHSTNVWGNFLPRCEIQNGGFFILLVSAYCTLGLIYLLMVKEIKQIYNCLKKNIKFACMVIDFFISVMAMIVNRGFNNIKRCKEIEQHNTTIITITIIDGLPF